MKKNKILIYISCFLILVASFFAFVLPKNNVSSAMSDIFTTKQVVNSYVRGFISDDVATTLGIFGVGDFDFTTYSGSSNSITFYTPNLYSYATDDTTDFFDFSKYNINNNLIQLFVGFDAGWSNTLGDLGVQLVWYGKTTMGLTNPGSVINIAFDTRNTTYLIDGQTTINQFAFLTNFIPFSLNYDYYYLGIKIVGAGASSLVYSDLVDMLSGLYIYTFDFSPQQMFNLFDHIGFNATFPYARDMVWDIAYDEGFNAGLTSQLGQSWFIEMFDGISDFFGIEILPGLPIGLFILVPLVLGVIFFLLKLVRG